MNTAATSQLRLRIDSDTANLAAVRHAVESLCAASGFDRQSCDEVGLCVNEALANIIRHAYAGATDRKIEISADVIDGLLRIAIRDWGNGVDPSRRPPPPPDPTRPGGLGLLCLARLMNRIQFSPQPDGMLLHMERANRGKAEHA